LRAAAIFAPLSSRSEAPKTMSSHKVAMKGRVPKAAAITFSLLRDGAMFPLCSYLSSGLPRNRQALESGAFFD
jgi:hypothetical protein